MPKNKIDKEIDIALCKLSKQSKFDFKFDKKTGEIINYGGDTATKFIAIAVKMLGIEHFTDIIRFMQEIEINIDNCGKKKKKK